MKKTRLKNRLRKIRKTFVHCFSFLAVLAAYGNGYRCILLFGEAQKTNHVTSENIKKLLKKNTNRNS